MQLLYRCMVCILLSYVNYAHLLRGPNYYHTVVFVIYLTNTHVCYYYRNERGGKKKTPGDTLVAVETVRASP